MLPHAHGQGGYLKFSISISTRTPARGTTSSCRKYGARADFALPNMADIGMRGNASSLIRSRVRSGTRTEDVLRGTGTRHQYPEGKAQQRTPVCLRFPFPDSSIGAGCKSIGSSPPFPEPSWLWALSLSIHTLLQLLKPVLDEDHADWRRVRIAGCDNALTAVPVSTSEPHRTSPQMPLCERHA